MIERFTEVRDRLTALVDGLRPTVVLAEPLGAFEAIKTTLAAFDPMGPVRTVVDGLKAEITVFVTDLAPSTLLAPVLDRVRRSRRRHRGVRHRRVRRSPCWRPWTRSVASWTAASTR